MERVISTLAPAASAALARPEPRYDFLVLLGTGVVAPKMSMQNYEIIRKLGQGSYGSVYLARQRDSGRQCVMKRMVLRSLNSMRARWRMT